MVEDNIRTMKAQSNKQILINLCQKYKVKKHKNKTDMIYQKTDWGKNLLRMIKDEEQIQLLNQ